MANQKAVDLQRWTAALATGNPGRIAATARDLAKAGSKVDTDYRFTVFDNLWIDEGGFTSDLMEGSGTDPRNDCPTAKLVLKGNSDWVDTFAECRNTMVGVTVETADLRFPFYVKSHNEHFEKGQLTHNIELRGIWDILNYYVIWPTWWLPIQAQPISHAVFFWALQTCLESMVAECALRLQSGIWEFVNNALSLNPDVRAWFGTLLQSNGNVFQMLKTPTYVKRTNPFLDTSPLFAKTVRMETCGTVIKDATKAYGVDTSMDLWLPGDPQPDRWANLNQPTYVFSTKDRSQIQGPTKTVLDSVLRTVVDLQGSILGRALDPILNPKGQNPALPDGAFEATAVGINFDAPYAIVVAPEPGEDSAVLSYDINHHTPDGWQHIIGGRSPKWVGAPGETRGHRPQGLNLTQRPLQRNVRLADRQPHDRRRIRWCAKRSARGVHEQRVLRLPARAALRAARGSWSVSPGDRTLLPDSEFAVQHRDPVRVHQRTVRLAGLHGGAGDHQPCRPRSPIRLRQRHFQGRLDVPRVPQANQDDHRLHREHHVADHPDRAHVDRADR
jgi:hypothetical protein